MPPATSFRLAVFCLILGGSLVGCRARAPEPDLREQRAARERRAVVEPVGGAAHGVDDAPARPVAPPRRPPAPIPAARRPGSPDPLGGVFGLEEATRGLEGEGPLVAELTTSMGRLSCRLRADSAPRTVASFVGLARGLRPFWDPAARAWRSAPVYDGVPFHRVIPGFMVQTGDPAGDGTGGVGYYVPDEVAPTDRHDRAGLLCMANRGPDTNESQFFITDGPAPHLDGGYTIFGECSPTDVVARIARVPRGPGDRPTAPVMLERVVVRRAAR